MTKQCCHHFMVMKTTFYNNFSPQDSHNPPFNLKGHPHSLVSTASCNNLSLYCLYFSPSFSQPNTGYVFYLLLTFESQQQNRAPFILIKPNLSNHQTLEKPKRKLKKTQVFIKQRHVKVMKYTSSVMKLQEKSRQLGCSYI